MSHRVSFHDAENLIVIVFEGTISPEEETQALRDTVNDTRMIRDARILVDRSRAQMTVAPEHVQPQLALVRDNLDKFGEARVAIVASADYDFGMLKMLEASARNPVPHDFMLFRSTDEACEWLQVNPSDIQWP
jgi:hypothetical protein